MTHVHLVEKLLACVGANDVEGALEVCSPDLRFVDVLAPMEHTVREVRGAAGLRDWFAGLHEEGVKSVTAEPCDLLELDDGRVFGAMRVTQSKAGDSFTSVVHAIWEIDAGRIAKIDSFLDIGLAMGAAGLAGNGPTRRWVEGVVTAKVVDRRAVTLRSAEHEGSEFSVRDSNVWRAIEVGTMGIAETEAGELVGWRSLSPQDR